MVGTVSSEDKVISAGVQDLIERLKEEGVNSGKNEAAQILDQAKHEAELIVKKATEEANSILAEAKSKADFTEQAGKDNLHMAARNTIF